MDIGDRIRSIRTSKRITASMIAKEIGVAQSFISAIENGTKKCSLETLDKICKILGITLSEFFAIEGQDLAQLPPDIWELVSASENYGLLRQIIILKKEGYSNEVIIEWLNSLNKALTDIKKKGVFVVGEYLPGDKKYTEQEEQEIAEKLSEKLNDPNFLPPWRKNSKPK
ncbi:MAG: helix-turn-helix transcriptional regulator [Pelotomaculum sp.]|nr:helix-turn-helix transcriptional regulator [Pelotomaculum sp.]